jgi:UDP-N-acetylglucosamine 2-epimerase (non-hydrolysing)
MVHLIMRSTGIITDSGGLQEEAVCAGKRVLICRDTTERPETTECGLGRLVDIDILNNISFLDKQLFSTEQFVNPFGTNVCQKITDLLIHLDSKLD